jgi:hypothetical protein
MNKGLKMRKLALGRNLTRGPARGAHSGLVNGLGEPTPRPVACFPAGPAQTCRRPGCAQTAWERAPTAGGTRYSRRGTASAASSRLRP